MENKARWSPLGSFARSCARKGPDPIRISRVKGHITEEQVINNQHRLIDKKGNDEADAIADLGVELHGKNTMAIPKILNDF